MNAIPDQIARENSVGELPRWKRSVDVVCSVVAMLVLGPLALVIAIIMKAASPGPLLFRQERVGHRGTRFMCLKFRTMVAGAESASHRGHCEALIRSNRPMTKMDTEGDSRMIPGGALLRASGLDELPQFINVLRGEMSLIGPRPCLPYEYELYESWQRERFDAMPGLTGLWQVSGKNRTTFEEMVRLDIRYARHLSPWLDLQIALRTVPTLIGQVVESRRQRARAAQPQRATPQPLLSPARETSAGQL